MDESTTCLMHSLRNQTQEESTFLASKLFNPKHPYPSSKAERPGKSYRHCSEVLLSALFEAKECLSQAAQLGQEASGSFNHNAQLDEAMKAFVKLKNGSHPPMIPTPTSQEAAQSSVQFEMTHNYPSGRCYYHLEA